MPQRTFRVWLFSLALLGVVCDQASKYGVFHWLYHSPQRFDRVDMKGEYPVIGDAFLLNVDYTLEPAEGFLQTISSDRMPRVNHGALFGLGNEGKKVLGWELTPKQANYFFAVVSIFAATAIIGWSFKHSTASDRLLCLSLGLILGGTIGNLYDRLVFHGVRDFLYFKLINWPVFNIADCCLVCGALLLLVQAFLTNPTPEPAAENPVDAPEPIAASPTPV